MDDKNNGKIIEFKPKNAKEPVKKEIKTPKEVPFTFKNNLVLIAFYTLLFIIILILTVSLPFFSINDLSITGITYIGKEEVEKKICYDQNRNFFVLYFSNIEKKLLDDSRIKTVETKFSFPNSLMIKVRERKLAGYIVYMNEYVYIDSDGIITEISSAKKENVPLIKGLKFTYFKAGTKLEVKNPESLSVIIELTNILNKYNLVPRIASIDVEIVEDIHIYIRDIDIILGSIQNSDLKIRQAIEILKEIEDRKGYLDVSITNGKAIFKPLT